MQDVVFFQRISILTVDSNTSLVVYLTNVSTLENFALILFFCVFVRNLVLTSWCSERFTWLTVVTSTLVFSWSFCCLVNSAGIPSTVFVLLDYSETLVSGEPASASEWP